MENSETSSDPAASTSKGAGAIDETMQMPTTAQLMEVMRHINPFDQKFREANEAMRASDFSQILGSLSASSSIGELGSAYNDPMLASITDSTLSALRAVSTSRSPNNDLRLKLPDAAISALTGVYSLLNGDDSGGCGLDTPDIAHLMTQMKEESSSKAAPLTADVLKTVLEIRETLDLQKAKKLSGTNQQPQLDDQGNTTGSGVLQYQETAQEIATDVSTKTPPGVGCLDQQHDIGPCDSLLSTDLDAHRLSSSPPAIPGHESAASSGIVILNTADGQMRAVSQQQVVITSNPALGQSTAPVSQGRSGDDVIIALKIGDQAVRIPVKINVSAVSNDSANSFMRASPIAPVTARKTSSGRTGTLPAVAPKPDNYASTTSAIAPSPQVVGGQSVLYPASAFGQAVLFEPAYGMKPVNTMLKNSVCVSPGADGDEEYRKREVLERNKQAACRYRKRKKEEMSTLNDRLKKTETEKLELSTQVQVLRMEIERLRNIIDLHKDCPVTKEQKKRKIDVLSFEHHAPVFHSLISAGGAQANEDSRSSTPPEQEDGSCAGLSAKSSETSGPSTIRVSTITKTATTAIVSSPSLLLSSQHALFSGTAAGGHMVQYVAFPSPSQSTTRREDGEIAAGQQKYILQPVIMAGTPTVVLPGTSSPKYEPTYQVRRFIFPTMVKMNAATYNNRDTMADGVWFCMVLRVHRRMWSRSIPLGRTIISRPFGSGATQRLCILRATSKNSGRSSQTKVNPFWTERFVS